MSDVFSAEEEMEVDEASDSDSEFVVVIPDCFNLEIPFSGQSSHCDTPQSHDQSHDKMSYQCLDVVEDGSRDYATVMTLHNAEILAQGSMPSAPPLSSLPQDSDPRPKPEQPELPVPDDTKASNTSPQMGRKEFVPKPITLSNVKAARLTNPLTVATGFVNTVTHLVEGLARPGKGEKSEGEHNSQQEPSNAKQQPSLVEEEEDDAFVVREREEGRREGGGEREREEGRKGGREEERKRKGERFVSVLYT